jgi:hypothetical protein
MAAGDEGARPVSTASGHDTRLWYHLLASISCDVIARPMQPRDRAQHPQRSRPSRGDCASQRIDACARYPRVCAGRRVSCAALRIQLNFERKVEAAGVEGSEATVGVRSIRASSTGRQPHRWTRADVAGQSM